MLYRTKTKLIAGAGVEFDAGVVVDLEEIGLTEANIEQLVESDSVESLTVDQSDEQQVELLDSLQKQADTIAELSAALEAERAKNAAPQRVLDDPTSVPNKRRAGKKAIETGDYVLAE